MEPQIEAGTHSAEVGVEGLLALVRYHLDRCTVGDIRAALAALDEVSAELRQSDDPRAIFPDIYSVITRNVLTALEQGYFLEPGFIARLAGRFAELYLDSLLRSLEGRPHTCSSWTLAYMRAEHPEALPVEHAALGISAHINFDLTVGIYDTILRLGIAQNPQALARFKRDHDSVNSILEQSLGECLHRLMARYECPATPMLSGAFRTFACKRIISMLTDWRDRVWNNVLSLLNAEDEQGRDAVLARMERNALRQGHKLSTLCRASRFLVH